MSKKPTGRNRSSRNPTVTTKSGRTIKINRSLSDRGKAKKAAREAKKAAYLATLPKDRWKRLLYRMHPKRVAAYWFSRDGAFMALKAIGVAIFLCFIITVGLFAYFRKDLPAIKDISGQNVGGSINYYDSTGKTLLWQDYNAVKRIPVQGAAISKYMKDATIAVEDKNFYKEGAFDVRGILRAGTHDLLGGGGSVQGGSTITQQLVKLNENWTNNRTITRKVKELILAVELERQYSKNDILTGYLNIAPYGGIEYGVESAAEDYFHTTAANLTLAQATMLAAIPQSPSYYSPYGDPRWNPAVTQGTFNQGALAGRQEYILNLMVTQGYITKADADAAMKVDVLSQIQPLSSKFNNIQAPYFVLAAKQELQQTYGETTVSRGGWNVTTTLNLDIQHEAEQAVANNLRNIRYAGADSEATVAENVPTGQIVALVGGTDFNNPTYGQNNYGAGILIPPGSSFKPYDYTTLINNNNNVGAGSVLYDTEGPLPGYPCTSKAPTPQSKSGNCLADYDFQQPGPITLRYALGGSRNIPAVKAMLESVPGASSPGAFITKGDIQSINKTIDTASALMDNTYDQAHNQKSYNCYADAALTQKTQCYDASAIGDGAFLNLDDHVNGLASIAREGAAIPRTFIQKIADSGGNIVYQWKQPKPVQVVRQDAAYIVDNMASDPNASYLPGSCTKTDCTSFKFQRYKGWDFAVKTGTTNDGFDGLMTSWSTQYAVASWVGNHTRTVTLHSPGMEYLTEPLTKTLMEYIHKSLTPVNWTPPKDLKTLPAFVVRNHIHYGDIEPSPTNDIFPSWYIGGSAGKTTATTIDRVSDALATSCTPAAAKQTIYNGNAASWNIDIFNGGKANIGTAIKSSSNTNSSATDTVHNCNDSPPTVTLTAPTNCPSTGCTITATVTQGTHPLSDPAYPQFPGTVTISLDGKTLYTSSVNDSPSTVSFNYTPTSTGSGTLKATATDSVLYSGSTTAAMSYTSSSPITITNINYTTNSAFVQWTGGSGSFSAFINNAATGSCSGVTENNCTVSPVNHGDGIVIKDSNGDVSGSSNVP
ncbi:MAG: transglycosylase domain-containing protein [Candidatus Saccharimonadales bacterium]